jgi:signal transduction histidine kinase
MEIQELERALEEAFSGTMLYAFVPGLLHNFANPLNGIMGRAKILERRLENLQAAMEKNAVQMPGTLAEDWLKIHSDVRLLNTESERFADVFQDVASRFGILTHKKEDRFDLPSLVRREVRFADHYLDFKHRVRKVLNLSDGVPPVRGVQAHFAMALWALLRHATVRMGSQGDHELNVTIGKENDRVLLGIRHTGTPLTDEEREDMEGVLDEGRQPRIQDRPHCALCLSLLLWKHYGAAVSVEQGQEIWISFPAC